MALTIAAPSQLNYLSTRRTPLGWMAAVGDGERLQGLKIGYASEAAVLAAIADELDEMPTKRWQPAALWEQLAAYAAGQVVDFSEVALDVSHLTRFQRQVVTLCQQIPYGATRSYGELAADAGSPRAARAVGNVMRTNRFPLIVPCHRVLAAGGRLGGFSAPDGVSFKQRLLDLEQRSVTG